jgi:methionyl-tRNA synthetase
MKILIGGAWPYANGLHIGHLAALLPGDVLARYHRAIGDEVYYVSGSDCHGTPVAILAKQENKTPQEVSDYYHNEFCACFEKLGFSYDLYGKTSSEQHKAFVTEFHRKLYESKYIYEKTAPEAYCSNCKTSLADRFVTGLCPSCGEEARGDQCDVCGGVLEPETLISPACSVCGEPAVLAPAKHLFLAIGQLEEELKTFINAHPHWRRNAVSFSNRYINEGLRDRAITRSLDWGIDVPKTGFEDEKIYIWAENVLGYLSASKQVCEERGTDFNALWGSDSKHYYVHGKDNIPFHTIIMPSLLLAHGDPWHLPDEIVSSEHLTLEGRKISSSQNWAIWVKDIVDRYNPDSLRYFLIANGPEKRDADFSWREFVNSHNGELLGTYGNFVNRNLVFIDKYFGSVIPQGKLRTDIEARIKQLYPCVGKKIEQCQFKDALDEIFSCIRFSNKYFDSEKPWETRNTDITACKDTLFNCIQLIANLAILLRPFLPFSSTKIIRWLSLKSDWSPHYVESGFIISEHEILFERIDKDVIIEESRKFI